VTGHKKQLILETYRGYCDKKPYTGDEEKAKKSKSNQYVLPWSLAQIGN